MNSVETEVKSAGLADLVSSLGIPARPSILEDIEKELKKEDSSMATLTRLVTMDVALSAAVLKVVNSPFYGMSRRAESLAEAISMLGLTRLQSLVTDLVLKNVLSNANMQLPRFWDTSAKRAYACMVMAKKRRYCAPDVAHTFGLFCDVGIPLLLQRFPTYGLTLQNANHETQRRFTDVEQAAHKTDHALVGAIMARSWGLPTNVGLAIRLHHDYDMMVSGETSKEVANLIAMSVLADGIIHLYEGRNNSAEWSKGGTRAQQVLDLQAEEFDELLEDIHHGFNENLA